MRSRLLVSDWFANQLPGLLSCIESCDLGHFQTYIKSCAPYSLLIGLQKLSLVIGLKPTVEFFMESSRIFLLTVPRWYILWIHFVICVSCLFCYTVLSIPCSLKVNCWESADFLALLCVFVSCVFVTFPYGVQLRCGT